MINHGDPWSGIGLQTLKIRHPPKMGSRNTQYNNVLNISPPRRDELQGSEWKAEAGAGLPLEKCMQPDHRLVRCGSSVVVVLQEKLFWNANNCFHMRVSKNGIQTEPFFGGSDLDIISEVCPTNSSHKSLVLYNFGPSYITTT